MAAQPNWFISLIMLIYLLTRMCTQHKSCNMIKSTPYPKQAGKQHQIVTQNRVITDLHSRRHNFTSHTLLQPTTEPQPRTLSEDIRDVLSSNVSKNISWQYSLCEIWCCLSQSNLPCKRGCAEDDHVSNFISKDQITTQRY